MLCHCPRKAANWLTIGSTRSSLDLFGSRPVRFPDVSSRWLRVCFLPSGQRHSGSVRQCGWSPARIVICPRAGGNGGAAPSVEVRWDGCCIASACLPFLFPLANVVTPAAMQQKQLPYPEAFWRVVGALSCISVCSSAPLAWKGEWAPAPRPKPALLDGKKGRRRRLFPIRKPNSQLGCQMRSPSRKPARCGRRIGYAC